MVERGSRITRTSGMNTWRAGCSGTGTSGSEGGSGKPTSREAGGAPRPDPYTQQRTDEGWLYLAVVLDCFSRRIVGWSMAEHLRTELVLDALDMAIAQRHPGAGLVHHSDHGCQYTSLAFGRRLRAAGLVASMGTVGDALDNAVAESFFATLECELLDRYDWPSRQALRTAVFDFIEVFYNRQRRHSTLDHLTPVDYEHQHPSPAPAA
jgi:putative transposase